MKILNYYYRKSNFNVLLPYRGKYFLWNTLSGATKKLEEKTERSAREEVVSLFSAAEQDLCQTEALAADGFIVPKEHNELDIIESDLRSRHPGGFYKIMTTEACNASCAYCYQNGGTLFMTAHTAARVADFIVKQLEMDQNSPAPEIEWFGGEPLLNTSAIDIICNRLSENRIFFRSTITTNGSLWSEELIQRASVLWNLHRVQITLDGMDAFHDDIKNLPSGSFKHIIRMIHCLIGADIRVIIRINHANDRLEQERNLLRFLKTEFSEEILSTRDMLRVCITPEYTKGTVYPDEAVRMTMRLRTEAEVLGLSGKRPGTSVDSPDVPHRKRLSCYSCNPDNYTVAPDGSLFNCTHCMTDEQRVGSIFQDCSSSVFREDTVRKSFLRTRLSDKCRRCALVPVCLGGCRIAEMDLAPMAQCCIYKSICSDIAQN